MYADILNEHVVITRYSASRPFITSRFENVSTVIQIGRRVAKEQTGMSFSYLQWRTNCRALQ